MLAIFIEIMLSVTAMHPVQLNTLLTGNTQFQNYYEITNVRCYPEFNKTYAVGVRYYTDVSNEKRVMHAQVLNADGACKTAKYFADKAIADPYIIVQGR